MNKKRCVWAETTPLFYTYHDTEWGVPVYDDQRLFEMLILEGAQAGLSWLTILKRRETYRKAFDNFKIEVVASYSDRKKEELLTNEGIIRNRLKIEATVANAQVFLRTQKEYGSFSTYLWEHMVPSFDPCNQNGMVLSKELSKDLKKRGCNFVGPTICYAYMQAIGIINDHEKTCFRFQELETNKHKIYL